MMKKIFLSIISLFTLVHASAQVKLESENYEVKLSDRGEIVYYLNTKDNLRDTVQFRTDRYAGPTFEGVDLSRNSGTDKSPIFAASKDGISYKVMYSDVKGTLCVEATVTNDKKSVFIPEKGVGFRLGINTYMEKFPEWNKIYFPTMIRAEKSHFNSYFMTPEEDVFTVTSPDAIASWRYIYQQTRLGNADVKAKEIETGVDAKNCLHRIYTVSLDILHRLPLPKRHPQDQYMLNAGESRSIKLFFNTSKGLESVNKQFNKYTQAPIHSARYYTIAVGGIFEGTILADDLLSVEIRTPRSEVTDLKVEKNKDGSFKWRYSPFSGIGLYSVTAISSNGKMSEMNLYVRPAFDFYLKSARSEALKFKPTDTHHAECFYPLYSYFLARRYMPDPELDAQAEDVFQDIFKVLYDDSVGEMRNGKFRVQDAATMIGVLADRYRVTKDTTDLLKASKLADFLLDTQREDGGYYSGHNVHYTSVIYLAKSIMELVTVEKELVSYPSWRERYDRHKSSVFRAIDDLERRGDDVETEGQMTFEDGMIACSATQLAFAALKTTDTKRAEAYTKQAVVLDKKHQCLTQKLMPDSRMNGATLRFWEYQYTINLLHGGMNSPCGWSAWKIYSTWYLYLLTGEYDYMRQTVNSLSSALQLLDYETGIFNFGFVKDPFIETLQYMETPKGSGNPKLQRIIVGEQYLPKMSDWHKDPMGTWRKDKWGIDNFNHEIIKCMSEMFLTNAYVLEREDGVLESINCTAKYRDGKLIVDYSNSLIKRVHVNLIKSTTIDVKPHGKSYKDVTGKSWLGGVPDDLRIL